MWGLWDTIPETLNFLNINPGGFIAVWILVSVDLYNSTPKKTLVFCLVSVTLKLGLGSVLGLEQKTLNFIGVEK